MLKFLLTKETIIFIVGTLWNFYDSYDCLINGNCGWKRDIFIEEFGIGRFMYLIFNIIFESLLLASFILHIQLDLNKKNNTHRRQNKKHNKKY
ncbi:hypothetical protein [Neisseria zalophi]|uniref:Uncharacterized protein n=1 Tax=Neisseria zalophi TaxID=640030 RepID=A0A5J6PZN8_9NEIS|nr:hypothetical protein [Neisseria zalophi]QEY26663.1 hypothetical protein D0T92_09070 [Neisseria zalophi]